MIIIITETVLLGCVVCAEILLQQAMAGSSPNSLLLSYLKHTVLSQVSTGTGWRSC